MIWRRPQLLAFAAIFVALALAIMALTAQTIVASSYEISDFAANSLLIQDAKSFRLLVGNYSRMGFNHPGPAILYVLAFGELVFHDWLNLTSPIGGQLVASAIYAAAWLTVIAAVTTTLLPGRWMAAAVFMAVFFAASASYDFHYARAIFLGIWPPYLYCLPFAAFLVALASATLGRSDHLAVLAISAGFAINGHISFVVICGTMIAAALAANTLLYVAFESVPSLFSVETIRANGRKLLIALGFGLLFFVPLILETISQFPGPVYDYVAFGGRHQTQDTAASFSYVASFLGGPLIAATGISVLAGLIIAQSKRKGVPLGALALISVFVGASIGTFVYAKFGIDDLVHVYLADYYLAVPAFALGLAAALTLELMPRLIRRGLSAGVVAACTCYWGWIVHQRPLHYEHYTSADVPAFYAKLAAFGPAIVLYPDGREEWGRVWSAILTGRLMARRIGWPSICVAKNWDVSMTREARCTEAEIATGTHLTVRWSGPAAGKPVSDMSGLVVEPAE